MDSSVVFFLENRSSLLAAIIGLILSCVSIVLGDYRFVIQVLLTGAVGYTIGITAAILGDFVLFVYSLYEQNHQMSLSLNVLLFLGCAYIAWLGFKHHQLVRYNKKQSVQGHAKHSPHVIPWLLVNEVRNSLLAMRLLLFQQANRSDHKGDDQEFKLVQDELLRLETIFGELTKYDENQK